MISIAIVSSIAILLLDTYRGRNFRYRPALLHSRRYSIPPTLVSILTIRCWVACVALNGNENYPHFIWVLVVMRGFAGTGLEGSKRPPDQNFRPPLERSSSSSGRGPPANRTLIPASCDVTSEFVVTNKVLLKS